MSYIIAVNPLILSLDGDGLNITQVATVTCLVAGVMSIAMGLYANIAVAIAPGLGLNAIVAFTLVDSMGLSFPQAMGVVAAEGIIIKIGRASCSESGDSAGVAVSVVTSTAQ